MKTYAIKNKLTETEDNLASLLIAMTPQQWQEDACRGLPHHKRLTEFLSRIPCTRVQLFPNCVLGTLLISQSQNAQTLLGFYFTDTRFYFIGEEAEFTKLIRRINKNGLPEDACPQNFLCHIINMLMDEDNLVLIGMEKSLAKMEEAAFSQDPKGSPLRLNDYRKTLRSYKSFYDQVYSLSLAMQTNPHNGLTQQQCMQYQHTGDRAALLCQHTRDLKEYAEQISGIYQAQLDMKQTKALNMLTVISAIFLPLTLLTGWYGMNFQYMPELKWPFSYGAVFLIAALVVGIEIWIFRKKGLL